MKYFIKIAVLFTIFSLLGCKTVKYVPVETTKIEYRDNLVRDSIFRYDSVFVKDKGDTLTIERYKYLYKNKIVKDSIFINDTIRVPYPVEVIKQVKEQLTNWQNIRLKAFNYLAVALFSILIFIFRKQILKVIKIVLKIK